MAAPILTLPKLIDGEERELAAELDFPVDAAPAEGKDVTVPVPAVPPASLRRPGQSPEDEVAGVWVTALPLKSQASFEELLFFS